MLELILVLVVIGVVLWGIEQIPMDATIRTVVRVVVIVLVVIWLAQFLIGVLPGGLGAWPGRLGTHPCP